VVGVEVAVVAADKCAISSWKEDVNLVVWNCTGGFLYFPVVDADTTTDNCKNDHPTGQNNSQSQGGFGNRFAALNNDSGARNRSGAFGSSMFAPSFLFVVLRRATPTASVLDCSLHFNESLLGALLPTPRTTL